MLLDWAPVIVDGLTGAGVPPNVAGAAPAVLAIVAGFVAGILLEILLVRVLPGLVSRSQTRLDDVLIHAVRGPVKVFGLLVGIAVAFLLTPAPEWVHLWAGRSLVILVVLVAVVVGARLLGGVVVAYGDRAHLRGSSARAVRRLLTIAIYLVGALLILDNQGVSITPLLTTMGLAGLAVALALQDTISNFFAGLYVQADRPLDVGHYVRLEDMNVEGYVVEVGWRTTKIRTLPNNIVVIPNSRVAQSVVTDYDLPEPRLSLLVRIPVSREADARRVEQILLEEAQAAEIPGLLKDPAPFVRFIPGFTDQGMEFTLISQVEKFVDQYAVQHELRFRILDRLRREGIALGYPVRLVAAAPGASVRLTPEADGGGRVRARD